MLVCPKCGSTYTRQMERCGLDGEALVESSIDPLVGRQIDRYTIVEPLGAGGMASVYRATHAFLDQSFAIKVLHGEFNADKMLAKRFQREAKALSRIKHQNVVSVADFGVTDEGLLFMVMEHLAGRTLARALREDGPFSPSRTAHVMRGTAQGLGAAHKRGYVHRDLKPGNIILEREADIETPKILDFGLVRILENDEPTTQLTMQGQFFGTPSYMSPEQASGGEVEPTSDIYSLGVIGYVMLTGSPPFSGEARELAYKHITEAPPEPPLPYAGLTPLMMEMLEKDAKDRPQNASVVIKRIDELGLVTHSGRPTKTSIIDRKKRRKKNAPPTIPTVARDEGTRSERPALSEPVLAEEREFLSTSQYSVIEDEDSRELQREALGFRRHRGRIIALAALCLVGFVGWQVYESDAFAFRQIRAFFSKDYTRETSASVEAIEPPPTEPVEPREVPEPEVTPPPRATEPPPPKRVTRRTPPRSPPPEPPPPAAPPPVAEPPPEPPPEEVEIELPKDDVAATGKSFRELDIALGWALNAKGLAWADLAEAAESEARNWSRWFKADGDPPAKILDQTYHSLSNVVEGIVVDRSLLNRKLARATKSLRRIPRDKRDVRYVSLESRQKALTRELSMASLPKREVDLAAEITLLEADAAGALREATAAPPPPPPPSDDTPPIGTSTSPQGK